VEELQIPELTTDQIEALCTNAENAARKYGADIQTHTEVTGLEVNKKLLILLKQIQKKIHPGVFAVMDGTYFWRGAGDLPIQMNTLLVGKDAVAVDARIVIEFDRIIKGGC
jgi:hypothetical protein